MTESSSGAPVGSAPPVCILGMHRSGTSMVTGMLSACGLWLGSDDRLMPAHPDNPDGYFENLDVVALNDALLKELGGSWNTLPQTPDGWLDSGPIEVLQARSSTLLNTLEQSATGRPWGWKDPRTCVTLPFWQRQLTGLKAIVCLRNPMAVARSLNRRDSLALCQGLELWRTYNQRLMANLTPGQFIVTHYDAWFNAPEDELRRLLGFLDWHVTDETITAAIRAVNPDHRRYEGATITSLMELGGPAPTTLYNELRGLAGPFYPAAAEELSTLVGHAPRNELEWTALSVRADKVSRLERQLEELRTHANAQAETITELRTALQAHSEALAHVRAQLAAQSQTETPHPASPRAGHRPAALHRLGDLIDFGRGGNAPLYTADGWPVPGPKATRLSADSARLALRLTEPVRQPIKLSATLRPVLPPNESLLTIEVVANGQTIARWTPTVLKMECFEAVIPVQGELTELQLELRIQPQEPSDGSERQGIALREMRLDAVPL